MKKYILTALLFGFLTNAHAEDINVKLACKGTSWVNGTKVDNNQGFISIANGWVTISGMLSADGTYKLDLAAIREDFLSFRSPNNPLMHGSINRVNGDAIVIESDKNSPSKTGQALFNGKCSKAKPLF